MSDPAFGSASGGTAVRQCDNPIYADVIVQRWQNLTGKDAVLESSRQTFGTVKAERGI